MNPANKAVLDDYRRFHDTLTKAGYLMGLSGSERSEMVRIIREEWMPGYATDLWCGPCVANMVLLCYRYYDDYLAKEAAKTTVESTPYSPVDSEPAVVAPDPAPPMSIQTKATFPSHKKHHRR
jgi:hypothetical protein